jgi:DNA repair exonuclease SbcCD ATPase subunit
LDLRKNKTTLIIGENGSGKSTILDALSYSLFGKPFRKVNKGQLVNTITKTNLVTEVEFSINTNDFKIVRGMRPNIFEVYLNGQLLNQDSQAKDYQETLEKHILKINHKSFCQVVVLGSATFQPFMQLSTSSRREIIEDLLDLQIFTVMNSLLKEKVLANKDALTEANADQKVITEKMNLIREHMIEIQNNNENIIIEKKERLQETRDQVDEFGEKIRKIEEEINLLSEKMAGSENSEKKMNKLTSLKHKIEANLNIINNEVSFFSDHDNCPTCKQDIDKDFKCTAIKQRQKNIDDINDGLQKLSEEYDKLAEELKVINSINDQIRQKYTDRQILSNQINSLISYAKNIEREISSIQKIVDDQDETKFLELETAMGINRQRVIDLNEKRLIYNAASSLLKDGGIKSKIIRQYVPVINKLINKYLSAMEFLVQFELDEEFNEKIKSRFRDEFSYASFSEGEKMRINLAVLFTWRAVAKLRNSINTNILIMDEVFDSSLDSTGTEEFMKILNDLTKDTNTFIISHKTDQISDKFEEVIKFEKHKNFSRIAA